MDKKNNNLKTVLLGIAFVLVASIIAISFAYFSINYEVGPSYNVSGGATSSEPKITFEENTDGIILEGAYPMPDSVGIEKSNEYEFTVKNIDSKKVTIDVYIQIRESNTLADNLVNTLYNGNVHTIGSLPEGTPIDTGFNKAYKLDSFDLDTNTSQSRTLKFWVNEAGTVENALNKNWSSKIYVIPSYTPDRALESLSGLNLKVAENNTVNFAEPAETDESANGLYSLEDDYGTSYYFRGAVENNYVKFGDYFWRIIRINGDGSLRMIYDGTQAYANGTSDAARLAWTSQAFNTNRNDAKYVGYMYGPAGTTKSASKEEAQSNIESSTIKIKLEEWYVTNIKNKGLDQYIADSIFCNDRSTPGKELTGLSDDTGLGYGTNLTAYGATSRIGAGWSGAITNLQPSFVCPQKNDAFTVEDMEKGNGALDEKVGLITADEIVAGGSGKFLSSNTSYYLYKGNNWYWSLSPYYLYSYDNVYSHCFIERGGLYSGSVHITGGVAPVINLKAEYVKTLRGEGTMSSPYTAE